MQSPDTTDTKASFRKPLNDVAHRKYRRRSSANGSSSSDRSPKHDHSSSPIFSREDPAKVSELQQRRKDVQRELDSDSDQRHHGRGGDSYRHSDKQSSRNSHGYTRHDDYVRQDKYANDEDRNYQRLSSSSGRESKASTHSDYTKQETEHSRSKDYLSSADKEKESYLERQKYKDKNSSSDRAGSGRRHTSSNSEEMGRDWHKRDRDGLDEKRDCRRSSRDYRNDRTVMCEESRAHRNEFSGKDYGGYRLKEAYRNDPKDLDGQKLAKEENKRYNHNENNRDKDQYYRDYKPDFVTEKQETLTKKQKVSNWYKGADDAVKKTPSSSVQAQDTGGIGAFVQAHANDSVANDLDAAKVAAMKAVELVNKNLVGVGYMSTDQKKKLLWGSKKSTTAEEPGHQWDTALFGDRDRQEKFNKLMSLRLPRYIWPIVGSERRSEGRAQTQRSIWEWSSPSREAEGTSAGFGETVHCWTTKERWPLSWVRSLNLNGESFLTLSSMFTDISLYLSSRILFLVLLYLRPVRELNLHFREFQMLRKEKCDFAIVTFHS